MNNLKAVLQQRAPLLLNNPNFRRLWFANLISRFGDRFGFVALNLYVLNLTGSGAAIGGLFTVQAIPALFIGPLAGVIIDRVRRRHVMLVANSVEAIIYILLAFTNYLWQIYALALLTRTIVSFFEPAQRSLLPDIVDKEQVLSANASLSAVSQVTLLLGPALAGLLVATSGAELAFGLNAATFLVANLFILGIRGEIPRTSPESQSATSWWHELKAGLRYGYANPALRVVLYTMFISSLSAAALLTIEVVYISDTLGGGEAGYGIMLSVVGIGAILSSMSASFLVKRFSLTGIYVASILCTGFLFFPYANANSLWLAIALAGIHGLPWMLNYILIDTMVQRWTDEEMRGRVFSLVETGRNAGLVLFAMTFAPLIDLWGPVILLNIAGLIYLCAGIYVWQKRKVLHHVDAQINLQ